MLLFEWWVRSNGRLCSASPRPSPESCAGNAHCPRVNTRLVEVDVVVHSKGQPVADLNQDDFTVLDNGKPQKVAAFNIVSSRTNAGKSVPLPPGAASNRLMTEGQEPAGTTVVLYDMLNTASEDQGYGRQALVQYLDTLQRGDHFALYSLGKTLSVIQDFTDDPERIRRQGDVRARRHPRIRPLTT